MLIFEGEGIKGMPRQLPVWKIAVQAYAFVWGQKFAFIKLASLPFIVFMIGKFVDLTPIIKHIFHDFGSDTPWFALTLSLTMASTKSLLFIFIITAFSVVWHRQFLIESETQEIHDLIDWRMRHTKFIIMATIFGIVGFVLFAPVVWLTKPLVSVIISSELIKASELSPLFFIIMVGALLMALKIAIGALLSARWCLIFPSIAVDGFISFRQSWNITSGNGLRLTGIIILSTLPIQIAAGILFKAFPLWEPFTGFSFLLDGVSYFVITAIGVSALSAAYHRLCTDYSTLTDMFQQR
ncbi:MAG: hypothetical protein JKY27_01595 [Magnetovibrio sp.]|nr:hypothetical protein [Magnetovibrio sp.]